MNKAEQDFERWWTDNESLTAAASVKQMCSLAWHNSSINTIDRISNPPQPIPNRVSDTEIK